MSTEITDEQRLAAIDAHNQAAEVVESTDGKVTAADAPKGSVAERDPGDLAAMMIKELARPYKKAIKDLTTGDCRRLALALGTWPFENEDIMAHNPALQNAFAMGDRLMQAKMVLIGDHIDNRERRQEEVKGILAEQTKEDESNG